MEAKELGIVSRVGDNAMDLAMEYANDIRLAAPVAVRTTVKTLRDAQNQRLEEAFEREATAQSECYPTGDLAEGVHALQQKRVPKFTGR